MEHNEKTNEIDRLFERVRSEFTKRAKAKTVIFFLFILILASYVIMLAVQHADMMEQLIYSLMFCLSVAMGSCYMTWFNKLTKADNAQDFLAIYDKNKKMEKWLIAYALIFLAAVVISIVSEYSIMFAIFFLALMMPALFVPNQDQKCAAEELRDAIQQS